MSPQPSETLRVNFSRLRSDLEDLARIGRGPDHGLYRPAFSDGDMAARRWLAERIEAAGLELHIDEAANIHGRLGWDGTRPSVMTGSHMDTVPGAGYLDGALGVVAGLESLRCLAERGEPLNYPLELVSFSDEEGRFGGMFGSQAVAGRLTPEAILTAEDLHGVRLVDAMGERGYDAMAALHARRSPGTVQGFVELHIEQGPVLDHAGINIGVVEGVFGLFRWSVNLKGTATHAGATPMGMRQDAFIGLAEVAGALQRILDENGSAESVATIGHVKLFPGAPNVVPGKAEFTLEVRDLSRDVLGELQLAFRRMISSTARKHGLMFEFEVLTEFEPVQCDPFIVGTIREAVSSLGFPAMDVPSGAAHDAQTLSNIARSGLIFVPSKDGRSHSPAEWTSWEAIEQGASVLLSTLHRMAA